MEKSITKIFIECQSSTATHPKLAKKLISVYLKSDFETFSSFFISLVKHSLIHGDKQPSIERTLAFIAKFSTSVKSEEEKNKLEEDEIDVDPFLVSVFEFLLKNHEANSKAVRYRVCQLINKILNSMGEQASIDDDLYSTIYDTMLQRLMDKVPAIRVQAILALSRLQDPRNKECPVIIAYLFHLSMDPNAEVRRAVLNNIAITFQTLPDILKRIRDTRELVRRQAYLILAQKVHIRSFTIAQRVLIITEGLNDRSEMVREAVKKNVLQAWLRLVDGSILELLKCLDVEASTQSAELALNSLFDGVPYLDLVQNFSSVLNDKKVIESEDLKAEAALYWKCLAKHLRSEKADDYLEEILPDLSAFCLYVNNFVLSQSPLGAEDPQETAVKMMEKDFVSQQLVSITMTFDLSDEVGRTSLCTLVRQLLLTPAVGDICVKNLSQVFGQLYPPVARVAQLVEIISEMREPPEEAASEEGPGSPGGGVGVTMETPKVTKITEDDERKRKIQLAQISVKLNQVREELEECVRCLNLERAQELKEVLEGLEEERARVGEASVTPHTTPIVPDTQAKMPEEDDEEVPQLDDPATLSRCLLLVCEFLSHSDVADFSAVLRSLHDNLILPCLKSEDPGVRRYAVRSLSLTCLMSKEMAQQHLLLFVQISQMDVEEIQLEALQGLFDFWLLYGVEEFNCIPVEGREESSSSSSMEEGGGNMIEVFTKMLDTESPAARTLSAEGLCKLLFAGQISAPRILAQLVILWYNPNTENDHLLRHMLGVFFPLYASLGGSNQECLARALVPCLHTLFDAPVRSPLAQVDVEDVVNFMVSVTSPGVGPKQSKQSLNAHDSLIFWLVSEYLSYPDRDYARALIRALPRMALSHSNRGTLKRVQALALKLKKTLTEKGLLNSLHKLEQNVESLMKLAPPPPSSPQSGNRGEGGDGGEETGGEEREKEGEDDTTLHARSEDDDSSAPLDPMSSSQGRRKRTLYSTHTDMQLISDLDSELERTPSKVKKMDDKSSNEVFSSEDSDFDEGKGDEISWQETKEDEKTVVSFTRELEVTMASPSPERESFDLVSSDLFASSQEARTSAVPADSVDVVATPRRSESESDDVTGGMSSSVCSESSPPRKSSRVQIGSVVSTRRRRGPSSMSSPKSGSSSFYSARSTSRSPEVFTPPSNKRRKNSGPYATGVAGRRLRTRKSEESDSSSTSTIADKRKTRTCEESEDSSTSAVEEGSKGRVLGSGTGTVERMPRTRRSKETDSSSTSTVDNVSESSPSGVQKKRRTRKSKGSDSTTSSAEKVSEKSDTLERKARTRRSKETDSSSTSTIEKRTQTRRTKESDSVEEKPKASRRSKESTDTNTIPVESRSRRRLIVGTASDRKAGTSKQPEKSTPAKGRDSSLKRTTGRDSSLKRNAARDSTASTDSSPKRTPVRDSSLKRTPGRDSSLKRTAGRDSSLKRTAGRDSRLKRTTGRDSSLKRNTARDSTASTDSSPKRTAGRDSSLKRTTGRDSSLKRTAGRDSRLKRTTGRDSSLKRNTARDSTASTDSSPTQTAGRDSSLKRTAGRDSSLKRTTGRDSNLKQNTARDSTASTDSSPTQTAGRDSSSKRTTSGNSNLKQTRTRDSSLKRTKIRDSSLKGTTSTDSSPKRTTGRDSILKQAAARDSRLKRTTARDSTASTDSSPKRTTGRDSSLKRTSPPDSTLKRTSAPDSSLKRNTRVSSLLWYGKGTSTKKGTESSSNTPTSGIEKRTASKRIASTSGSPASSGLTSTPSRRSNRKK